MLRDKTGEFNYLTTYVFVIDSKGIDLVNPAFPQHEGRNVLALKDSKGKSFIRDMIAMLANRTAAGSPIRGQSQGAQNHPTRRPT
jgi:signal transduction histidine kinase